MQSPPSWRFKHRPPTRQRERAALARQRELELLNRLSLRVASEKSVTSTAEFIASQVIEVIGAERVALYANSSGARGLRALSQSGDPKPSSGEAALVSWVLKTSKAVGMPLGEGVPVDQRVVSVEADDAVPGGIRAVVMDFGLGKAIQPDPDLVRLTQTGIILGTPEFMSPEQVRGEKIDARSDIFGLGIVAFELFTGQLPFAGRTSQESMMSRLRGRPRAARSVRPDLPSRLEAVLNRAMALSPDQRYQSMQAFADDLGTADEKGFFRRLFGR